jgi:putative transposase
LRSRERFTKLLRLLKRDPRARVRRATVQRRGSKWYVSFTVVRSPKRRRARRPHAVVGVDVGLRHLATLSTGVRVENLRPLQTLNIAGMKANRRLARHISDAGWGIVLDQLKYKTAWAGSRLEPADRFYPSSKTCSDCGTVKAKLSLSERVFSCEACGLSLDRDENAAHNLASLALAVAQAKGSSALFVAATGAETPNARGATDREAHGPDGRPPRTAKAPSTGHPAVDETAAVAA